MSCSKVLSILDGSNVVSVARGEIWVSPEVLDSLGLPNETAGIVELAIDVGADICFVSCQGPQAVPCKADALRDAVRKVQSGDLACGVVVDGPWGRLSRREGLLSLLSDLRNASRVERDLAAEANVVREECHAWMEAGADLILLADDLAGGAGPYFSPVLFAQILLPQYQQILATAAGVGVPLGFHSDGDLSLLLPTLVGAGFSCFSLEPEAVSVADFRARYGGQVTLLSGIRAEWLSRRHPHWIASTDPATELANLASAGNLILSSACGLWTPDAVPALKEVYRLADHLMRGRKERDDIMEATRVLVVDDHLIVRQGLRSLLSQYQDIQVVGEADGGSGVLELVARLRPDVVLLDVRLSDSSGLDLARQLRRTQPESRVIILTAFDDDAYLVEAAQVGARGYLLKSTSAEVLADTIRAVRAGEWRISSAMAGKAFQQLQVMSRARTQSENGLSDEELHLLRLIADGSSVEDITQALFLSERTVKRKTQDILAKLSASSRAQAVAEAFKRGLL